MKITILTLFPEMFQGPFDYSIIKRAIEKGLLNINIVNIRNFGKGPHKIVDDKPYGGGAGMILRADVLGEAIEKTKCSDKKLKEKIILLTPQGKPLKQELVKNFSKTDHLILIAAHYEGIDERIEKLIDKKISIGDYILTGGELPVMVLTDAIARLLPGVLGKKESSEFESFEEITIDNKKVRVLEYPQYTRPPEYRGQKVPDILLSGNHKKIKEWREKEAFKKTKKERPDLLRS